MSEVSRPLWLKLFQTLSNPEVTGTLNDLLLKKKTKKTKKTSMMK